MLSLCKSNWKFAKLGKVQPCFTSISSEPPTLTMSFAIMCKLVYKIVYTILILRVFTFAIHVRLPLQRPSAVPSLGKHRYSPVFWSATKKHCPRPVMSVSSEQKSSSFKKTIQTLPLLLKKVLGCFLVIHHRPPPLLYKVRKIDISER